MSLPLYLIQSLFLSLNWTNSCFKLRKKSKILTHDEDLNQTEHLFRSRIPIWLHCHCPAAALAYINTRNITSQRYSSHRFYFFHKHYNRTAIVIDDAVGVVTEESVVVPAFGILAVEVALLVLVAIVAVYPHDPKIWRMICNLSVFCSPATVFLCVAQSSACLWESLSFRCPVGVVFMGVPGCGRACVTGVSWPFSVCASSVPVSVLCVGASVLKGALMAWCLWECLNVWT